MKGARDFTFLHDFAGYEARETGAPQVHACCVDGTVVPLSLFVTAAVFNGPRRHGNRACRLDGTHRRAHGLGCRVCEPLAGDYDRHAREMIAVWEVQIRRAGGGGDDHEACQCGGLAHHMQRKFSVITFGENLALATPQRVLALKNYRQALGDAKPMK